VAHRLAIDAEARLVYAIAGMAAGCAPPPAPPADRPFSWELVMALAERERAVAALHEYVKTILADGSASAPSAEQWARLQRSTVMSAMCMSHLELRLHELVAAYAAAGMTVMLLKGAALAVTVYPSFARRPMADLDLLVAPERAREAWELATRLGWRKATAEQLDPFYAVHHHLPTLEDSHGTGLALEIHTALFPRDNPFGIAPAELWRSARPVDTGGHRALVPGDRDMLLHLCTHFAWTHALLVAGWRTFRDIGALSAAGRVDWDDVAHGLRRTPAATCCYWTLRLGRSLAGLDIPAEVLTALAPPLPPRVLGAIERYYVARLCPPRGWDARTARLPKVLWSLGIQPRWSGHGASRPWAMSELFVEHSPHAMLDGEVDPRSAPRATLAARGRQLWRELRVLAP
jgi:hypothetical protein